MTFTDDDLKRLKEGLTGKSASVIDFEPGWLPALLARLLALGLLDAAWTLTTRLETAERTVSGKDEA